MRMGSGCGVGCISETGQENEKVVQKNGLQLGDSRYPRRSFLPQICVS